MGVHGLWKTITDLGKRKSLGSHLTELKVNVNNVPVLNGTIRIGVDISTLMAECTGATLAAGVNGQFSGGTLYILFTKLAAYLGYPATFIFVFEGPGRPPVKRGHAVKNVPLHWEPRARVLIRNFGFHVHDAPGEAEAELAKLNQLGLIDAIMTSDGDVFVFGGCTILRSLPTSAKELFKDEIMLFTDNDLREINLSRGGLLLFALLCGGDYDSGIEDCGALTAHALCKCGFGDSLLDALNTLDGIELQVFMSKWRAELRLELTTNSQKMLTHRQRSVASRIDDTFPKQHVINLYISPLTSWSAIPSNIPNTGLWISREPSLRDLTIFCSDNFFWDTDVLLKKFPKLIWTGALLQMLYSPLSLYDDSTGILSTPNSQVTILENKRMVRQGRLGKESGITDPQPRITASTANFVSLMSDIFPTDSAEDIKVWIPEALLPESLKRLPRKKRASRWAKMPVHIVKKRVSRRAKDSAKQPIKKRRPVKKRGSPKANFSTQPSPALDQPVASGSNTQDLPLTPPKPKRFLGFIDLTLDSD